jgi:hypothetical protein
MGVPHGPRSTMVVTPTTGRPLRIQAYEENSLPSIYPQNAGKHIYLYDLDSKQYSYKGKVPMITPEAKRFRLHTLLADWAVSIINENLKKAGCMSRSMFEIGSRLMTERDSQWIEKPFVEELAAFHVECSNLQNRHIRFECFVPLSTSQLDRFHILSTNNCLELTNSNWRNRITRNETEMLYLLSDQHCQEDKRLWRPLLEATNPGKPLAMTLAQVKYEPTDMDDAERGLRRTGDYSDLLIYYVEKRAEEHMNLRGQGGPSEGREEVLRRFRRAVFRIRWQSSYPIVRGGRGARGASPIARLYLRGGLRRRRSSFGGRSRSMPTTGRSMPVIGRGVPRGGRNRGAILRALQRHPRRILESISE